MSGVGDRTLTRPVYVEHCSPIGIPAKVRRYDDFRAAADGVRMALRMGTGTPIEEAFLAGRPFWYGSDSWRVVTAEDFLERMLYDCRMAGRMTLGQDVTDLQG